MGMNVEGDRELLLDSLCYAIIDETDQTRRNKKYVDIYDEYAFISLCVSHLNIFVYLYVYYLIMTVFRAIRIRFPLKLLFTEISLTYCTVPYCTYCTDADKMMNRLINCPTDCRIRLFVLSMRCDFLFPQFFFRHFSYSSLYLTQFAQFVIVIFARRF